MAEGEWIKHDGKGMPVDGDVLVRVKFGDGLIGLANAKDLNGSITRDSCWIWNGPSHCEIQEYQIVKEAEHG
jgi:hypothetical protein